MAKATDEIQVYNAAIAAVGQFTIQQHLNYIPLGLKEPPFPGGLVSNHSLNGTPEFAYGVTDWWELGLYLPFAVENQQFLSNAFKVRTLFVSPHADQRDFFYGINLEFSNTMPKFAQTRFALEIRPIIGVRNTDWEFIVNPIVDAGVFGKLGELDFAPAAPGAQACPRNVFRSRILFRPRRDRKLSELADQQHTLFLVTDFKAGVFDVDFGVGHGLTPGSTVGLSRPSLATRFLFRAALESSGDRSGAGPVNPMSKFPCGRPSPRLRLLLHRTPPRRAHFERQQANVQSYHGCWRLRIRPSLPLLMCWKASAPGIEVP